MVLNMRRGRNLRWRVLIGALVSLNLAACTSSESSVPLTPTIHFVTDEESFCPPPPGWFTYRVQAGDTLREIAERANSSISELSAANCLNNPRIIPAGTVLYVPQRIG